eukprot:3411106-Amphidinium_carterae.1
MFFDIDLVTCEQKVEECAVQAAKFPPTKKTVTANYEVQCAFYPPRKIEKQAALPSNSKMKTAMLTVAVVSYVLDTIPTEILT